VRQVRARTLSPKDRSIAAADFEGAGKETEFRVDGIPGLVLVVTKPGRSGRSQRIWRVYYSHTHADGRTIRKVRLGQYPGIGLAVARRRAAEIMEAVDQRLDPVAEERQRAAQRAGNALTFRNLVDDYITDQRRAGFVSIVEVERALRKDILPALGQMRPSAITSVDVQQAVDAVLARVQEARGKQHSGEMARHCLRYIKQVFNHALFDNEELRAKYALTANPAASVGRNRRGKPGRYGKTRVRERALTDAEIVTFWRAMDKSEMGAMTQLLLKLLLLTGVRVTELRKPARRS
jgi:integrase